MPEIQTSKQALATITAMLDKRESRLLDLLGEDEAKRFRILALQMCERTPALLECTPLSLVGVALEAAELRLPLAQSLGYAWAVPFYDKKVGRKRAVFVPGYKGLMELARRSGAVDHIWADVIRKDDDYVIQEGTTLSLTHSKPNLEEQDAKYLEDENIIAAYCCARLSNGMTVFKVMPKAQIDQVRNGSPSSQYGPWRTHYAEMAMKTPIRYICNKQLPLSTQDQRVITRDEYFDSGVTPELTEVEYEEVHASSPETTAIEPEVLDGPQPTLGGPVAPGTLRSISERISYHQMSDEQVSHLCDRFGGVQGPADMSEDDAQEMLASLTQNGDEAPVRAPA